MEIIDKTHGLTGPIRFDESGTGIMMQSMGGTIFRSENRGLNWTSDTISTGWFTGGFDVKQGQVLLNSALAIANGCNRIFVFLAVSTVPVTILARPLHARKLRKLV